MGSPYCTLLTLASWKRLSIIFTCWIHRDAIYPWQGHLPQGSEVKQWYEMYTCNTV